MHAATIASYTPGLVPGTAPYACPRCIARRQQRFSTLQACEFLYGIASSTKVLVRLDFITVPRSSGTQATKATDHAAGPRPGLANSTILTVQLKAALENSPMTNEAGTRKVSATKRNM
eukprot:CAMPEP_0115342938 /NCGR_PEP_ID=MMETSP0270-20121206/92471_1 /TAXON_ID=71861 /ORGANISM="Scrippsiella trochoidea, Strain CCMP3099" /LENGTH=117 /DNA_ID=CAMNT_0002764541 /DNA_START=591 /DNA_END=944 /DNA_ORIENTATION=-